MLINEKTWEFIREHANDDVRKLALKGVKDQDVNMPIALQQIAGRQTAFRKLPSWAAVDGIIYPPHLNMEQCSSEMTARYKAQLVIEDGHSKTDEERSKMDDGRQMKGENKTFVDLTGGFGVDFYWMSQAFTHRSCVEQNERLCAISSENFRSLGLDCSVCCCDTATYLTEMPHADVVYLDPARRDEHGARTYGIGDCSPNILELLPQLIKKADRIVMKLSPMLDWRKAVGDLEATSNQQETTSNQQEATSDQRKAISEKCSVYVNEVHIVSVDNECKELLIEVRSQKSEGSHYQVHCVNLQTNGEIQHFSFTPKALQNDTLTSHSPAPKAFHSDVLNSQSSLPASHSSLLSSGFLYEPNASIMKAGCFAELEMCFYVKKVADNSHLFLSDENLVKFPGRKFQILAISSANQKEFKKKFSESLVKVNQKLTSMESANIAVRNFPLTADHLRKKLKLKDGGDCYIFATTLSDGQHKLFICRKIG